MSLTYGFYNAVNHDRTYDAVQLSSIFDGIIKDGIFMSIGDHFAVTAGTGMIVNVGSGRAWFNHTWTLNDAQLPITVDESEVVLTRIDALIIEVNSEVSVRANTIKMVKGTPSSTPERPTLTNTETIHQYALAYIQVDPGVTEITQEKITSVIGSEPTPYITGILETIDITTMVAQWQSQWDIWINHMEETGEEWFNTQRQDFIDLKNDYFTEIETWKASQESAFETWSTAEKAAFEAWELTIRDILDQGAAGHLQNEIDAIYEMDDDDVDSIFDI